MSLPYQKSPKINPLKKYDYVHIDDDPIIRHFWNAKAREKGKTLLSLSGKKELERHIDTLDKDSSFYIDYHLNEERNGLELASLLYKEGFNQLYMATFETDILKKSNSNVIQGVVSKTPPWI